MPPEIYIVSNDEGELLAIWSHVHEARECHLHLATTARQALHDLELGSPDLVIGCFPLEGTDSALFCRQVRLLAGCPLIAIYDPSEKYLGIELLNAGCDVCLPQPIDWDALLANINAVLSTQAQRQAQFRFGEIAVDFRSRKVWRRDRQLDLTPREFNLLRYLILHMNEVLSREQLLREVWHRPPSSGASRTVDQYILKLRKLIEPSPRQPRYIITIYGEGYKFVPGE